MKTTEQKVKLIQQLEIELSKMEAQYGKYGNNFPKQLKLLRKIQKLRDSL